MSFNYQVILKPRDIKFSVKKIPNRFDNGKVLKDVYDEISSGKISYKDLPPPEVVWDDERFDWYTLSNRRLWILQELEKNNILGYVGMSRVELVDDSNSRAPKLYSKIELYKPSWEIAISTSGADGTVSETTTESNSKTPNNLDDEPMEQEHESDEEWVEKPDQLSHELSKLDFVEQRSKLKSVVYRSNQSLSSSVSLFSTISREERIIDNNSGLSGYGYYHTYKKEYLDKMKAGKKALLEKYKPYNVNQSRSRGSSRCSSRQKLIGSSLSYSCDSVFSERSLKRERRESLSSSTSNLRKSHRSRNNSHDIESNETAVALYKKESTSSSTSCSRYNGGIDLAGLYAMWQRRRIEYLRSVRLSITDRSSYSPYYVCGLCFKKFSTIVDLQQHSEALLHYACITCGKFFSTYASLGQHCQRLSHKKD